MTVEAGSATQVISGNSQDGLASYRPSMAENGNMNAFRSSMKMIRSYRETHSLIATLKVSAEQLRYERASASACRTLCSRPAALPSAPH